MTAYVGNRYDKYDTKNPIARWLMRRFLRTVTALASSTAPRSLLEVGCGEGRLTQHLFECLAPERIAACDLGLDRIDSRCSSTIEFTAASIYELPYGNEAFDLVVCCEVLEHLDDPARGMAELVRVARRALLVSTPYEPWFRTMNVLRGAYLSALGNTPGHLQHFTSRSLARLVPPAFRVTRIATPMPWVVVLAERSVPDFAAPGERLR